MCFAKLVTHITSDPAAHAALRAEIPAATRRYAMLFAPRCGSTWITKLLYGTWRFGMPYEYLNPDQVAAYAQESRTNDPATLLDMLMRRHKTKNDVFGIKLRAVDIHLFGEDVFFAGFASEARFFCLWRDDLVAQGVSLYRALASGRWHSYETPRPPPAYDADAIAGHVANVAGMENMNERLLRRRGIEALRLRYEDFVQDPDGIVRLFATRIGLPASDSPPVRQPSEELSRIANDWNETAQARFMAERGDFVAGLQADRLVLKQPARSDELTWPDHRRI